MESIKCMITCPICLEVLQDPVYLRCEHTFCKLCAVKLLSVSAASLCPKCKGCEVMEFRQSHRALTLIDAYYKLADCEVKPPTEIEDKCLQGERFESPYQHPPPIDWSSINRTNRPRQKHYQKFHVDEIVWSERPACQGESNGARRRRNRRKQLFRHDE